MCFEFNAQLGGRENLIVGIEETICVKFALKMAGKKYTVKRKYEDEHRTFLQHRTSGRVYIVLLNVMASHSALYPRRH